MFQPIPLCLLYAQLIYYRAAGASDAESFVKAIYSERYPPAETPKSSGDLFQIGTAVHIPSRPNVVVVRVPAQATLRKVLVCGEADKKAPQAPKALLNAKPTQRVSADQTKEKRRPRALKDTPKAAHQKDDQADSVEALMESKQVGLASLVKGFASFLGNLIRKVTERVIQRHDTKLLEAQAKIFQKVFHVGDKHADKAGDELKPRPHEGIALDSAEHK